MSRDECAAATTESREDEMNEARDALAEAMFRSQFSAPNDEGADREWMERGLYETGYRASIVLGLLHDLGFDVREVEA